MYTHSLKSLAWHLVMICLPRDTFAAFLAAFTTFS